MTVLGILQNMWFKDPQRVRETFARHDADFRRRLIQWALFAGCRTGKELRATFGKGWCDAIIWEEASPEIGGEACSTFPACPVHLQSVIDAVNPDVVIAFGSVAWEGLKQLQHGPFIILAPHPCARGIDTRARLHEARLALEDYRDAIIP